jgi:hypothetical protein
MSLTDEAISRIRALTRSPGARHTAGRGHPNAMRAASDDVEKLMHISTTETWLRSVVLGDVEGSVTRRSTHHERSAWHTGCQACWNCHQFTLNR